MAIITTSRGNVLAITAKVQEVASTLDDVFRELTLPPADLPDEQTTVLDISHERIREAGSTLYEVFHEVDRLVRHQVNTLPPGPGEEILPFPGPHLGNRALTRSLRAVREHVSTYQQLASLHESTVRDWDQVGGKGLDALKELLTSRGLQFAGR